jgi:aryl-alcohol dehydrogenase-like predicted oxidoreductase
MSILNKLILGTVQFGLNYGINNSSGKISEEEAFTILDIAAENEIKYLDTADSYGNASEIIGNYHRIKENRFKVLTKFKVDSLHYSIFDKVKNSLKILETEKLYCYSYHSFSDFINYPKIKNELQVLKNNGIVEKIGISIYTNNEFLKVIDSEIIDVIQIPYNILDNNNLRGHLIQKAKHNGKEIHSRSVFLQGLFFMNLNKMPEKLLPLKKYLILLNDFANAESLSIMSLTLNYVINNPLIDHVLIGVDNKNQLLQNLNIIDTKFFDFLNSFASSISVKEIELLNPVNWE